VAIAIEGGGMRGCVGAGMVSAFQHLGLESAIDVVYGSSAGSLVGAYFISGQLPYFGLEVYYDVLTTAGDKFIDLQAILRSCGLGLLDLRPERLRDLFNSRMGKPVLDLDFLVDTIVQKVKPLDFDKLWEKQTSNQLELKVVASGLLSRKAVVLSAKNGNFQTLKELAECMKASMLLPGITGDAVRLKGRQAEGANIMKTWWREYSSWSASNLTRGSEPLSDALIFEPIPYRSAISPEGRCTHVVALRTRFFIILFYFIIFIYFCIQKERMMLV
jgi:predicted acylesterase/phospholipase RssA